MNNKLITAFLLALLTCSCNNNQEIKQKIVDHIEVHDGVRVNCDVKVNDIEISDYTVADSLKVLRNPQERMKLPKAAFFLFGGSESMITDYQKQRPDTTLIIGKLVTAKIKYKVLGQECEMNAKILFDNELKDIRLFTK